MSAQTARVAHASTNRFSIRRRSEHAASRRRLARPTVGARASVAALLLSSAVWMVWSVVVVHLPAIGFTFTVNQLFWLAALPALSGATLRLFCSVMVPVFGGHRWTAASTAALLLPAVGIGFAVQDPATGYPTLIVLALLCGAGAGSATAVMGSTSAPGCERGGATPGLHAALANLGVPLAQLVVPLAVAVGVFGALGGAPQALVQDADTARIWLQNAGFIWVPFILAASIAAWFGPGDVRDARVSFAQQAIMFRHRHSWLAGWLYIGTFGSFIGYAAAFPLLAKLHFPYEHVLAYAFAGPLAGALAQPLGGWLAGRTGGGRVICWAFGAMVLASLGVLWSLPTGASAGSFPGVLAMFLLLFVAAGIGSGAIYRLVPAVLRMARERQAAGSGARDHERSLGDAREQAIGVLGFASSIGAYGGFFIPKSYGSSIAITGGPEAALYVFIAFYVSCTLVAWWYYARGRMVR